MKREFEENEENNTENSIPVSVEDMTEEELSQFLEDLYIREAEERKKDLFADEDFQDYEMTDQEVKDSYKDLVNRLKEEGIYEEPSEAADNETAEKVPENKEDLSRRENRPDKKKTSHSHIRNLGKVAGVGIVCALCIFAASMTSEANRNYFINGFRILSGTDTRTVVGNDSKNENMDTDEYQAMADIEEKLDVEMPEFYYRPYGMEFLDYSAESTSTAAWIEYQYKKNIITIYIDKQSEDVASIIHSMAGDEVQLIKTISDGIEVSIGKIEEEKDEKPSYTAKWERDKVSYFIAGKIEEKELIKIIKNMSY